MRRLSYVPYGMRSVSGNARSNGVFRARIARSSTHEIQQQDVPAHGGLALDHAGWRIGRNYQLFRYMLACNRDGELPLAFNGGIFTTDNKPGRITGNINEFQVFAPEPR